MTDLTAARLLCERMTPGDWEHGRPFTDALEGHDPINAGCWFSLAQVAVELDGKPSEEGEANAAGIVLAVSLLRALCDEGAVERMARVHYETFRKLSSDDAGQYGNWTDLSWHRREWHKQAMQAIITSIFDAAGREG